MIGTLVNAAAIGLGSGMGLIAGRRLPPRVADIVLQVMGPLVIVIGIQMALTAQTAAQSVVVLIALVTGSVVGEGINIERRVEQIGQHLEAWVSQRLGPSSVTKAFLTTSILYVVGPMAILGSLQDGLQGDPSLLFVKSALDGLASIAFTASLGIGVLFSIGPVVLYQGILTLLGQFIGAAISPDMIAGLTATGGILIMSVGINLLNLVPLRVGNFLPALIMIAILISLFPIWNWEI